MNQAIDTDVLIVGAGLVGLTAALALQSLGKRVVLVDAKQPDFSAPTGWDQRIYAISPGNVQWLRQLGVWDKVDVARVNPMRAMHLWYDEAALSLTSDDAHLAELGVILEQQNLMHALGQCLNEHAIDLIYGVSGQSISHNEDTIVYTMHDGRHIHAQLLIGADSAQSWVRDALGISTAVRDFAQTAVVANFKADYPHHDVAYQWFKPHETLALLPLPNRHVSLVWSLPTAIAQQKLSLTGADLAAELGLATQHVLGHYSLVGETAGFALKQLTARHVVAQRAVLIGDAAHQVHPMAGQGVNLGFHDVKEFTSHLAATHGMMPLGDAQVLKGYARARKAEVMEMNLLTSGLDYLFAMEDSRVQAITQWGFKQVGQRDWLKTRLIQRAVV